MTNYIDTRLNYLLAQRAAEMVAGGQTAKRGRPKKRIMGTPSVGLLALPPPDWYHNYRLPTAQEEYQFARRLRIGMRVMTNMNSPSPYRMATVNYIDKGCVWVDVTFDDRPTRSIAWHVSYFDPVPSI